MAGETDGQAIYRFGEFTFDSRTGELRRASEIETLRPQVAAALALLLERSGELVGRDELRHELWQDGRIVSFDMAISTVVRQLRRALGDDPREPRYIETIPKRGYRLRCAVDIMPRPSNAPRRVSPFRRRVTRAAGLLFLSLATLFLGGTASPPDSRSSVLEVPLVAVLPFTNLTGEGANDIHAHALTNAVIGYLSRVAPDRLRVTGMASVLSYDRDEPLKAIGAELDADFVLEGAFQRSDETVIVSIRLMDPENGAVVWSRDHRRAAESPELAARSIAALTANELAGITLAPEEPKPESGERNGEAVARTREAVFIRDRYGQSRGGEAVELLRQATELDPDYAEAHAVLAETLISVMGMDRSAERMEEARRAALDALELDSLSATAHRVLGNIHLYFDRAWDTAGVHLNRATELAPGDAQVHHSMALWHSARGQHAEAAGAIELARALDPRSVAVNTDVMFVHLYARDFEGTIRATRRLSQLRPESDWHLRWEIIARLGLGDIAGAAGVARAASEGLARLTDREPASPVPDDREAIRTYFFELGEALAEYAQSRPIDPVGIAQWYSLAGQAGRANELIEAGLEARTFSYFVPFLGVSPAFDPLRGSVAFEQNLRGLAQSGLSPVEDGIAIASANP